MSDRSVEAMQAEAEAREDMRRAKQILDESQQKLDDVYGIVWDGPDMSETQVELLSLLPDEVLAELEALAEEYAENVRDHARLARKALELKARRDQGS